MDQCQLSEWDFSEISQLAKRKTFVKSQLSILEDVTCLKHTLSAHPKAASPNWRNMIEPRLAQGIRPAAPLDLRGPPKT